VASIQKSGQAPAASLPRHDGAREIHRRQPELRGSPMEVAVPAFGLLLS
jgi:hypothetical protein